MAKYLGMAKYKAEGVRGVLKEGGSSRVATVTKLVKSMGGKLEAFYFAYGGHDAYVIVDVPDDATAIAVSMAVNASGVVTIEMVPLLTAKQVDEATTKVVKYRAPGA